MDLQYTLHVPQNIFFWNAEMGFMIVVSMAIYNFYLAPF